MFASYSSLLLIACSVSKQLSIVTGATPFFTNLVDSDDAAGEVMGAGSSEGAEDDVHLSFRNITDIRKVCLEFRSHFSE